MNEIKQLRIQQINNYMSSFYDLRDISVDDIEEGLKQILGEKPGVDFKINETTGKDDRINELKKIHIFFTYIDNDNLPKAGKISYIVG